MSLENPTSADHLAAEAGSFEPQRANNFSVEIALGESDRDLISMGLDGFTIPAVSNESIEIHYQNEVRKVAGKASVEDGSLKLKDFVDQDTRGAILRWRKLVYDQATGKIGLAKNYKKTVNVVMTAPDGTSVRVAKLKGVYPSADPATDLAMEGSDKVLMEVPLSVDKVDWSENISGL